jgi:hypothetical protein
MQGTTDTVQGTFDINQETPTRKQKSETENPVLRKFSEHLENSGNNGHHSGNN